MIYEYKDLKGIIQVGDTVRAVPGKFNPCGELFANGSNIQKITKVDDIGFLINGCFHPYDQNDFLDLISAPITWETLKRPTE